MADVPRSRGAPLPGQNGPRLYPVWWTRSNDTPADYTAISEDWFGTWVHWCQADEEHPRGRSQLCVADMEDCPYHALPREWVGYLDVWSHTARVPGGLVLTPTLARDLAKLAGPHGGLFGVRFTVWHAGRTSGGGVRGKIADSARVVGEPKRIDLQPTLQRLFGLSRTPAQLVLPDGRRDLIPFPEPEDTSRYGLGEAKGGAR